MTQFLFTLPEIFTKWYIDLHSDRKRGTAFMEVSQNISSFCSVSGYIGFTPVSWTLTHLMAEIIWLSIANGTRLEDLVSQLLRKFHWLNGPNLVRQKVFSQYVFCPSEADYTLPPFQDRKSLLTLVQALVISRVDYCNAFFMGLPLKAVWKLQQVQNAGASLVTDTMKFDHILYVRVHLPW